MFLSRIQVYDIACERYRNLQEIERKNIELRNREAMLNLLINSQPAHIFAKNADDHFRYVMANQKFAEFVGLPINEVIGKTDRELFAHSEDGRWFETRDAEIMAGGQSRNFPEAAFGANGVQIQFQTVKTPCIGPNGENLLLGISVDITRSANISKSHEIIRQCLETLVLNPNLEAGIDSAIEQVRKHIGADRIYLFHFDFERRCGRFYKEFHNKNCCALFDEAQDIPLSTSFNWIKHFKNDCFLTIPDARDDATLQKFGPYYENIIRMEDTRSLYGHRLLIAGKLWGYVGIAFEKRRRILSSDELDFVQSAARFVEIMIQHEQMQSELLRALKDAKAAEKAKSYFLATMSHEIRTPLNAVIGFSEILQDGSLPPETQKSYLKDISVAGNALLALINDVLDLSKLEAGQMVFAPVETDFPALVDEVATIFQQRFRDKKLENIICLAPMPTLLIDKLRMRQILFNLVGNAVKFTDRGHIKLSGTFTPSGDSCGTLCFSLEDTGCGISEEDQKRLFQPFVQSNAIRGTQAAQNGTGLGLAIIRRMLERRNGEISVKSAPGKGSTFTVTMHRVAYIVKRHVNAPEQSAQVVAPQHMTGRVLVVDDVAVNLKVTQAMLTRIGVSSVVANGPVEALECLKQKDITLVLCDLWMPVMNGDELARKIRKLYPERNLKLVALTADTETSGTFDMNEFNAVLHKPVNMEALRKLIADFCETCAGI
ncbi:MAG: ATP-binding protein [Victivallaceae bacterium]|nr:ATP-binding protein [Victivallaceae bacterium]